MAFEDFKTFIKTWENLINYNIKKYSTEKGRKEFMEIWPRSQEEIDRENINALLDNTSEWDRQIKKENTRTDNVDNELSKSIQDMTNSNIENAINGASIDNGLDNSLKQSINLTKDLWEREDEIRKATWEREDTAYQRAVKDALAAGINVNLTGVTPASSGGGITNATNYNLELYKEEFQKSADLLTQYIENEFKGDQAEKDRLSNLVQTTLEALVKALGMSMAGG